MKTHYGYPLVLLLVLAFSGTALAQLGKSDGVIFALYNHPQDNHSFIQPYTKPANARNDVSFTSFQSGPSAQIQQGNWQGCAALAVGHNNQQFYLAEKHRVEPGLWIQEKTGGHRSSRVTDTRLRNTFLAKMAMGPDGHVYAISTSLRGRQSHYGRALLLRYRNGKGEPEILGALESSDFDPNTMTYSGDMAFSADGSLFIFGTEIDTVLNAYKGAHILRINAHSLQKLPLEKKIRVDYIASISGMGFDQHGHFLLAATDKETEQETYFFQGRIRYGQTQVYAQPRPLNVPNGFVVSDLASAAFPNFSILKAPAFIPAVAAAGSPASWEQSVTIRTFRF
jgi:hypothetical protein